MCLGDVEINTINKVFLLRLYIPYRACAPEMASLRTSNTTSTADPVTLLLTIFKGWGERRKKKKKEETRKGKPGKEKLPLLYQQQVRTWLLGQGNLSAFWRLCNQFFRPGCFSLSGRFYCPQSRRTKSVALSHASALPKTSHPLLPLFLQKEKKVGKKQKNNKKPHK